MKKFRVCLRSGLPAEECIVEARDGADAIAQRYMDLVDWVDLAELEAEEIREDGAGADRHH